MPFIWQMAIWLTIGLLIEAYLLVGRKIDSGLIFITGLCLAFASMGLIFSSEDGRLFIGPNDNLGEHILLFAFLFSITFGWFLKDFIMKSINEQTLVVFSLLFLYFYVQKQAIIGFFGYVFLAFIALTVINGLISWSLNKFFKVILYVWYLFMIVYFAATQFSPSNFEPLLSNSPTAGITGITMLLTGMAFLYLTIHAWYLIQLIPIPGKTQTFRERIREWREDMDLMASKFSDEQAHPLNVLLIIAGVGAILVFNFYFQLLPNWLISSLAIAIVPIITTRHEPVISNTISNKGLRRSI